MRNLRACLCFLFYVLIISQVSGADYFWVGGSGNWSDISHWATSSGGATTYPTVPSANDRVIFDENSFTGPNQVISVLVENIFCLDMDWTAATNQPTFSAPRTTQLNVHGSFQLSPNMNWNFAGEIRFRATGIGQNIATANHPLAYSAYFSGFGGSWNLQDSFVVDSVLFLDEGSLNMGNSIIQTQFLHAHEASSNFNLNMGNAYILVTGAPFRTNFFMGGNYASAQFRGDQNTIDPGTATMELSGIDAEIWSDGTSTLSLPNIIMSAPLGKTFIGARNTFADIITGDALDIKNLTFASNAEVYTSGSIDTLRFSPGKSYVFEAGSNFDIIDLDADGTCTTPISWSSSDGSNPVQIQANSGTITGDFLSLRGIIASGGANFVINDGADLGGNAGWTFNNGPTQDLFWVGGDGDWDDAANWSFSSGGPGGACLPNGATNVFFDANSFDAPNQTVNVAIDQISFLSMEWTGATGNPIFQSMASTVLSCFGSLTLINGMDWMHTGEVQFLSNQLGNTIQLAGQTLMGNAEFDGVGGEWILQDTFRAFNDILLLNGHLNSNSQFIETFRFLSLTENDRQLTLGSSTFRLGRNGENVWEVNSNNFIFDAGTSHLIATGDNAAIRVEQPNSHHFHHVTSFGFINIFADLNNQSDLSIQRLDLRNQTFLGQDMRVDTLLLSPNYRYAITPGITMDIGHIVANGDCENLIFIQANEPYATAFFTSENDQTINRAVLENIHIEGSGIWTANQSADVGNNDGWVFNNNTSRTLFWVGDIGNWSDPANWALSSGGAGGECIPSANDNVIFDANSFTSLNATVFNSSGLAFARDIDWRNATNRPNFEPNSLWCHGSLYLSPNMNTVNFGRLTFKGTGDHEIASHDFTWGLTEFIAEGTYTLLTDFRPGLDSRILFRSVNFNTNDFAIETGDIYISVQQGNQSHSYNFGSSTITLLGSPVGFPALTVEDGVIANMDPGTSEIIITSPDDNVLINSSFPLNNLSFTASDGNCQLQTSFDENLETTFNKLIFNSNASMLGFATMDSLIFSAGKTYQFSSIGRATVNEYLQATGNNCLPISIGATIPGQQAALVMPSTATIRADFVQMQDQNASGGANFFAGNFSNDVGNNTGWTFGTPSANEQTGFLGTDPYVCAPTEPVILNANFNTAGEQYRWQDGSNNATFSASLPGIYFAEVTFPAAANCIIRDTIEVLSPPTFNVDLPADTTLCEEDTILLDATSPVLEVQYLWQDSSQNAAFLVDTSGLYRVNLIFENCIKTDSIQISYAEFPNLELGSDQTICPNDTIEIGSNTLMADRFLWSEGSTSPTLAVSQSGQFILVAANAECISRDTINIDQLSPLGAVLGPDQDLCEGNSLTLNPGINNATFQWSDGSTNDSLILNLGGTYFVDIQRGDCIDRDSIVVSELPLPRFDLGMDLEACEGEMVEVDGTSALNGASYQWEDGSTDPMRNLSTTGTFILQAELNNCTFSDSLMVNFNPLPVVDLGADQSFCEGEESTLDVTNRDASYLWSDGSTDATLNVNSSGTFSVNVSLGNCSATDTIEILVNPLPRFDLGMDQEACEGEMVDVDGTSALNGASYQWEDGSTDPMRSLSTTGTFILQAELNNCTFSDSVMVNFNPLPVVDLGGDQTFCEGEESTLDVTNRDASYLWSDGSTDAILSVNSSGTFSVNVSLGNCSAADTIEILVNPLPRFNLGMDQEACEGEVVEVDGTSALNGASYQWEDGSTDPMRSLSNTGTFVLQAELNNCTFSDSVMVNFNPLPVVDLGADQTFCEGEESTLDVTNRDASYLWSDGSTDAILSVNSSGTFSVNVSLGNCSATDTIEILVNPLPRFDLGMDQEACEGEMVDVDGTSALNGASYQWEDGSTDPMRSLSTTGTFFLLAELNNCTFSDSLMVNFNPLPVVDLGADQDLCEGDQADLDATINGATYLWNDGSMGPILSTNTTGTYFVAVSLNNCISQDTVALNFAPVPVIDLGMDQDRCLGDSIRIDGTSNLANVTYSWNDGINGPVRVFRNGGTFSLTATSGNCSASDDITLNFIDLAAVSLGSDFSLCEGDMRTISPSQSASNYLWQDGSNNQSFTINQAGLYWVEISESNCSARDSIMVSLSSTPQVNLGSDIERCAGETVTLDAGSSGDLFFWSTGATSNSINVNTSGLFSVEVERDACIGRDTIRVDFQVPPTINLGPDLEQCEDLPLTLSVPGGLSGPWEWSDGSVGSRIEVTSSGTYWLESRGACVVRDSVEITLIECIRFQYYAPNAFSPNNDGVNDQFRLFFDDRISISNFQLQIHDRWGNLLFNSADPNEAWDGKVAGELLSTGAYIWSVQLDYQDDFRSRQIAEGGEILLIR